MFQVQSLRRAKVNDFPQKCLSLQKARGKDFPLKKKKHLVNSIKLAENHISREMLVVVIKPINLKCF